MSIFVRRRCSIRRRRITGFARLCSLAAVGLGLNGNSALAQPTDPASTPPDLSGYWMITFDPIPPHRDPTPLERSLLDLLPPDAVLLGDAGLPDFRPGDYGGLQIRESALAAAADYDPESVRSVSTTCQPPGLIYSMQGPFGIEIFQGTQLIVLKLEYYDAVRIVFMNETEHPDDWPLSAVGHSIGRWENDTLVVETTRLKPDTLFNNGVNHSDQLLYIERFRRSEDGSKLVVTQQFSDPQTFIGTAARILPLDHDDTHVYPYDCDPAYGLAIESRER